MARHDPTATDLKILEYLQQGHSLNHLEVLRLFKTNQSRDVFYRLRRAGYDILSTPVRYVNSEGKKKHYINYSIKKQAA